MIAQARLLAPIMTADTVTTLDQSHAGAVLVTGSHGGLVAGGFAAAAGVAAVIFNDAGYGLDDAAIASLPMFDAHGVPAATVSHRSARIGDARDSMARGLVSRVNRSAAALGVRIGQPCRDAATRLRASTATWRGEILEEARFPIAIIAGIEVFGLDSAALALPGDAGRILVVGSHGGLPGGMTAKALKVDARAALFNDAGIGIENAGIGRLPALDARGIAAATVDSMTARIGDARSAWATGIISHVNAAARRLGGAPGQSVRAFVGHVARARDLETCTQPTRP